MAFLDGMFKRGLLMTLLVALGMAAGLIYMTTGGGDVARAQAVGLIVQVSPEDGQARAPALVQAAGRHVIVYAYEPPGEPHGLYRKTSGDGGNTWSPPDLLVEGPVWAPDIGMAPDGTLWMVYQRWVEESESQDIYYMTSTPDGLTWSDERPVVEGFLDQHSPAVAVTNSGRIIVAWQIEGEAGPAVWSRSSDDGGETWGGFTRLDDPDTMEKATMPDLAAEAGGDVMAVFTAYNHITDQWGIFQRTSTDNGETWSAPTFVHEGYQASLAASGTPGIVDIAFVRDDCFEGPLGYCDSNVWSSNTTDLGASWSEPAKWTEYQGRDDGPSLISGGVMAWESDRRLGNPHWTLEATIWFTKDLPPVDTDPPPAIVRLEHRPSPNPRAGDEVRVLSRVAGDLIGPPVLMISRNRWHEPDIEMTDRWEGRYTASLGILEDAGARYEYSVTSEDVNGNVMTSWTGEFKVQSEFRKHHDVLLIVDDMSDEVVKEIAPFYEEALHAAGFPHDFWDTSRLGPVRPEVLEHYRHGAVVYAVPDHDAWLLQRRWPQDVLRDFVKRGGSLFMAGQQIAEHFAGEDPGWLAGVLGAEFVSPGAPNEVEGVAGDRVGDGLFLGLEGGDGADRSHSPDEIRPVDAVPVFLYVGEGIVEDGIAAVRYRRGRSRVVFLAFSFESIYRWTIRRDVMWRAVSWINPTCNGRASTIDGTSGPDIIYGTPHDDVIVTYGGHDRVFAGEGNDTICGGRHTDVLFGGPGNDWIGGYGGSDRINGGPGADIINGGGGDDLILGGHGDDVIWGNRGDDQVAGGAGDDFIHGGAGFDDLLGDDGSDVINGGRDDDYMDCGGDSDIAHGGSGIDEAEPSCELRSSVEVPL